MIDQEDHINLPPLELLLDYLDGIVDPTSRRKIEEQIEVSDQLASTIEGIRYYYQVKGYDRSQIEAYIGAMEKPLKDNAAQPVLKRSFVPWRVAAVVALLVSASAIFFFSWDSQTADEIVIGELSIIYPAPDTFRGEGQALEEFWGRASTLYAAKQYRTAIGGLIKIDRMDGESPDSWFYIGLCYLYSTPPKTSEASKYLVKVAETQHRLADRARWFLALSYYLEGKIEPAKERLREIEDNGGYKSDEANQLLNKLD